MADILTARHANYKIEIDGVDVTGDVTSFVEAFSYTDYSADKADEISLQLDNTDGRWSKDWQPDKGINIRAQINVFGGGLPAQYLYCGTFSIDEIESSWPPSVVQVKAISSPVTTALRREMKTATFENRTLKSIAQDVAANAGLELFFDASVNPSYKRRDQKAKSDLSFLQTLCKKEGLSLKITDTQIVIFEEAKYEKLESIGTIDFHKSLVSSWRFKNQSHETYDSAKVSYHNAETKETSEYIWQDEKVSGTKQTLEVNERVESSGEAERLAKNKLREKNKKEKTGSISLAGNVNLVAGACVNLTGFGSFDGKYFIEQAQHTFSSAYKTDIEIRKVLDY